jgi:uncharacterized protein YqgC (DUF456 family)
MSPDWYQLTFQTVLQALTLFVLLVGLVGLIMPIFPGLTVMWLGTLVYGLFSYAAGGMTVWDWVLFALITLLMIGGNIIDNIIIARKMRDQYVPWSSIFLSFVAGLVASIFFTPLIGLAASPLALFGVEYLRVRNRQAAWDGTKAYMIGWGWAFGVRFLIGLFITGLWMLWAWA